MDQFVKTDKVFGLLMDFQLAQLPNLINIMKKHDKKVLIHLDLIKGLASDEFAAIYLIQELKVDGIITTKPRVVKVCKKRGVIGIMRVFLKDRHSLDQTIELVQSTEPDLLEVLPYMPSIVKYLQSKLACSILMGGLISTPKQVEKTLNKGVVAITTSKVELWNHAFHPPLSNRKEEIYEI